MAVVFYVMLLFRLFVVVGSEDIPEFQYPCYVDICTFPTQFCNSERFERRCSPCTKAICRERKVPLACKYICRKYDTPSTTTTTTTTTPFPTKSAHALGGESSNDGYYSSSFVLLGYSAISTTLIFILLVILLLCHFRRQSKQQNNCYKLGDTQRSFRSGLVEQDVEQQKSLVSEVASRLVEAGQDYTDQGRELPVNDSPPSYTTSGDQNEENEAPEQATSSVPGGNHRQVCCSYTTNPSPDGDDTQHERPWAPRGGAKPKNTNQVAQMLTQTQQPQSAMNLNNILNNKPLNNASEMARHRSLASEDGQRALVRELTEVDRRGDDLNESDTEETSLKS